VDGLIGLLLLGFAGLIFCVGGLVGSITAQPEDNIYLVQTPDKEHEVILADNCEVIATEENLALLCKKYDTTVFSGEVLEFEVVKEY
jgi:hypothetical protein